MLILLLASLTVQSTAPNHNPVDMNHMARDGVISPLNSVFTVEWTCSRRQAPTRARIIVKDAGAPTRNQLFKSKLDDLRIRGEPARASVRRKVELALDQINNVALFQGRCRNEAPLLLVTGFSLEDGRYEKQEFELDLTK